MAQNDGQPSSSAMAETAASAVQDEVLELNRKFYKWISSSWEMCPHFCWNGAAQEYINQINRILDGASRPGFTAHSPTEAGNWASRSPSTPHNRPQLASAPPAGSTPPQHTIPVTTQPQQTLPMATQPFALTPTVPSPIPSASPTIPSSAGRSRKRVAQGDHPDDPNASNTAKPGFTFGTSTPASAPKARPSSLQPKPAIADKSAAADKPLAPMPTPPLFSSFASAASKPASFSTPAAFGALATAPAFGAPASSSAPSFGAPATSSAAAGQPSAAPAFSFKPATSGAPDPKSPTFPLFSGLSKPGGASSAAAAGFGAAASSSGFSFGNPAGGGAASSAATNLFNFSKPADGAAGGAAASFSFSAPSGGGFGAAGPSTPPFNFGGGAAAAAAAPAAGDAAAGGEDEEEAQEKPQKIEMKGDDKTDITFSGRTAFRVKNEGGWAEPIVGILTLRRDKASRRCWLQVNSETKGSIFVYGSIPDGAKFKVLEGKPTVNMVLNIFRYPPGQEPRKTGDAGKGGKKQLPEKEENSSSPKTVMMKLKTTDLQPAVDALIDVGCKQL